MKRSIFRKVNILVSALLIVCLFGGTTAVSADVISDEISLGGVSFYMNKFYDNTKATANDTVTKLLDKAVAVPENIAITKNVEDYVNVRKGPGTDYSVVGYLIKNGVCVVESISDGWAKIESGDVKGYIYANYLYTGEEGHDRAVEQACLMATVNADTLNVRSKPDTTDRSNILATLSRGEALEVIEETVVSKDCSTRLWVKVYYGDKEAYVAKQYVNIAYDWIRAVPMSSIVGADAASNLSQLRASLVIEAKQHIGLKYVWGGNSLYTGCDCSGFVLQVYKACGIDITKLPRCSYDIADSSKGRKVSLSEAKPGDLVFYGDEDGNVNHVAMYLGNGQIIHESGSRYGCRTQDVYFRKVLKVKNFID